MMAYRYDIVEHAEDDWECTIQFEHWFPFIAGTGATRLDAIWDCMERIVAWERGEHIRRQMASLRSHHGGGDL